MPTLPTPGADYDSWGTELNEWLAEGGISFHSDGFSSIEDAIAATAAASGQLHLSPGTLVTSLNPATDITARLVGPGQIEDTNGDLRAPWFSAIGSPPSSYGNWGSVVSAFNGDLSKVQIAMEHRITGATTLTQPATGYNNNPEAAAINMFTYNESGWNQGTADSDGRTGGHGMYLTAYQAGLGDLFCITAHGFVSGTKPGSTSFVANAATGLLNGGTYAGADGVYLNTIEIGADDQTYDAAATGMVVNLHRRLERCPCAERRHGTGGCRDDGVRRCRRVPGRARLGRCRVGDDRVVAVRGDHDVGQSADLFGRDSD
jgi:hypothetical protein